MLMLLSGSQTAEEESPMIKSPKSWSTTSPPPRTARSSLWMTISSETLLKFSTKPPRDQCMGSFSLKRSSLFSLAYIPYFYLRLISIEFFFFFLLFQIWFWFTSVQSLRGISWWISDTEVNARSRNGHLPQTPAFQLQRRDSVQDLE